MKKSIKWLLAALILFLAIFTSTLIYEAATGDFRLSNITHDFPQDPEWNMPPPTDEQKAWLTEVMDQPYRWLGQGHQIYAFASSDQRYVLKIFKFKRLKPSWTTKYLSYIPFVNTYFSHQENKRLRRLDKLFRGYKLAYIVDRAQTGILFLHLNNQSTDLNQQVTVIDKLGISHTLELDSLVFAIQEHALKTKDVLKALLKEANVTAVEQHINNLFDMYMSEYKLGIMDQDHNILQNTGFVGERPIRLDIGQLKYDEAIRDPAMQKQDLIKITSKRINRWLLSDYPDMQPQIAADMEHKLSELFGEPIRLPSEKR